MHIFADANHQLLLYLNKPMNFSDLITNVVALAAGGIITVAVGYYFIKNDLKHYLDIRDAEFKKEDRKQLLPLRLQAHERLIIFIERINPSNLFLRLHEQGIPVTALQAAILNDIRSEYQHNVTQQLYVSQELWEVVKKLKDDTLAMVNNAIAGLPEGAMGVDLSRMILQHMAGLENNPYDLTINLIKKDVHQLF